MKIQTLIYVSCISYIGSMHAWSGVVASNNTNFKLKISNLGTTKVDEGLLIKDLNYILNPHTAMDDQKDLLLKLTRQTAFGAGNSLSELNLSLQIDDEWHSIGKVRLKVKGLFVGTNMYQSIIVPTQEGDSDAEKEYREGRESTEGGGTSISQSDVLITDNHILTYKITVLNYDPRKGSDNNIRITVDQIKDIDLNSFRK